MQLQAKALIALWLHGLCYSAFTACAVQRITTERNLGLWIFYDLCFRWFADVAGFEAFLELTGGVHMEAAVWIRRARDVMAACPCPEYFFGSTTDGRRCVPRNLFASKLAVLGWRPTWAGRADSDQTPSRALAFVAFLDDWLRGAMEISACVSRLRASRSGLRNLAVDIALAYCLPGFAYAGHTRKLEYYWPKFPFSDLVLYFQLLSGVGGLGERKLEALQQVTFNGRGGRLPLLAFDLVPSCELFANLRRLDQCLLKDETLALHGYWGDGTKLGCPPASMITAYDPQVANCMIMKHDICVIKPPHQRFLGISPLLSRFFQHWRASHTAERGNKRMREDA